MMKRFFCGLLAVLLLTLGLSVPASAMDKSQKYNFSLSVDGNTEKKAAAGDVITVTFTLQRTDAEEDYTMYTVQDEILYDSTFFELVPDSAMVKDKVETTDLARRDQDRAFYMNYVSLSGGETWKPDTVVGTFQLKVIGTSGSSVIRNSNNLVSTKDGQDSYESTSQNVTVTVSEKCTVTFETNGGSEVPNQILALGDKIRCPENPTKEGFDLEGWYSDLDLQNRWDFDKDKVGGNMTLYAKWTEEKNESAHTWNLWWLILLLLLLIVLVLILWGRKNALHRGDGTDSDTFTNDTEKEEKEE